MNRLEGNQNELTFVNQDEEKRQAQKKVHFQNMENLKEEYKRREGSGSSQED